MELWVRSQDKKQLSKVNDGLFIANGFTNTDDSFIGIKNVGHVGRYKTEERALEVLDEIENALLNKWANNVRYEEHYDDEKPSSLVYEMPEE